MRSRAAFLGLDKLAELIYAIVNQLLVLCSLTNNKQPTTNNQ
jgi:hypothetical protein